MASVLVSVPRLASFSFMRRWERWRRQKKVADTASTTRMKSMQRTESSRNWPDSTRVSFTTGIWVRLPLWRRRREREPTVRAQRHSSLSDRCSSVIYSSLASSLWRLSFHPQARLHSTASASSPIASQLPVTRLPFNQHRCRIDREAAEPFHRSEFSSFLWHQNIR